MKPADMLVALCLGIAVILPVSHGQFRGRGQVQVQVARVPSGDQLNCPGEGNYRIAGFCHLYLACGSGAVRGIPMSCSIGTVFAGNQDGSGICTYNDPTDPCFNNNNNNNNNGRFNNNNNNNGRVNNNNNNNNNGRFNNNNNNQRPFLNGRGRPTVNNVDNSNGWNRINNNRNRNNNRNNNNNQNNRQVINIPMQEVQDLDVNDCRNIQQTLNRQLLTLVQGAVGRREVFNLPVLSLGGRGCQNQGIRPTRPSQNQNQNQQNTNPWQRG